MSKIKNVYSKIAPATKSQINVKSDKLEQLINDLEKKLRTKSEAEYKRLMDRLQEIDRKQSDLEKQNKILVQRIEKLHEEQNKAMTMQMEKLYGEQNKVSILSEQFSDSLKKSYELSQKSHTLLQTTSQAVEETVWGETFNNAICDSAWLINKSFFPGRWAVGYQYLYVLYRVLNEYRPKSILELGLGQSTHMITQYAAKGEGVAHRVVEHDSEWINFFKREHRLAEQSEIVQLGLDKEKVFEDDEVLVYKDFKEKAGNRSYDFISIDAPFGGQAKVYARVDTLKLIPECLAESFVIMVDDANRIGEQNTIRLIKSRLEESGIDYASGIYKGKKETYIITSNNNRFLCTL